MSIINKVVLKEYPPTKIDDTSKGFCVGFKWVDTKNKKAYISFDCSIGGALWKEITLFQEMPEGEFKGDWVEVNRKKKFNKRKGVVRFDSIPIIEPSSIQIFDVEYEGTADLKIIRITKTKFVFSVMSINNNGSLAQLSFKYKALK